MEGDVGNLFPSLSHEDFCPGPQTQGRCVLVPLNNVAFVRVQRSGDTWEVTDRFYISLTQSNKPLHNCSNNCTNHCHISFFSYLILCLVDDISLILHHFDGYRLLVGHPRAFCNCAEGALPQDGLHQVRGGFGAEQVSDDDLVILGRWSGRHV